MNICLESFGIFFRIGVFTTGEGYAVALLIENKVATEQRRIAQEDFIDLPAIPQPVLGTLVVSISILIGYKLRGVRGSITIALEIILLSFIIILVIAFFFHSFEDNPIAKRVFKGMRLTVVVLIVTPTLATGQSARINRYNLRIPIVSTLLIWLLGFFPVWIIITAGVGSSLWGKFKKVENEHPRL